MDTIELVFITDDNYAMPTAVAIKSAILNKNRDSVYHISVVCVDLSEDNKRAFQSMETDTASITLIEPEDTGKFQACSQQTVHVSKAALFKFDLPNLLPELDRVLYMDGDIIIQGDLGDLFRMPLGDCYVAAAKDAATELVYNPTMRQKLGIAGTHRFYFNSGVMLLNLKQLRAENISGKLLEYRLTGLNFFMDQDTLNVILGVRCKPLPVKYNFMTTMVDRVERKLLEAFYGAAIPKQNYAAFANAVVLHCTSPAKPWLYDMPFLSVLFRTYYAQTPYADEPLKLLPKPVDEKRAAAVNAKKQSTKQNAMAFYRDKWAVDRFWAGAKGNLLNQTEKRDKEIIVSLTTFPARIHEVRKTLVPIFNQTMKPDRVILWLTNEEFPNHEADLPKELLDLRQHGLEIGWGENLRAHTKYFYSMTNYPDAIVITVDDDVHYSETLVEQLYQSYLKFPNAISALRAHSIRFDESGDVLPYRNWGYQDSSLVGVPSMALLATGVGGVLYPPHLLPACTFDKQAIRNACLRADDIWLKFMEVKANVPVVLASKNENLSFVGDTQMVGLCYDNVDLLGNDACIYNMIAFCDMDGQLLSRIRKDSHGIAAAMASKAAEPKKLSFLKRVKRKVKKIVNSLGIVKRIKRKLKKSLKNLLKDELRTSIDQNAVRRLDWLQENLLRQQAQLEAQEQLLARLSEQQAKLLEELNRR